MAALGVGIAGLASGGCPHNIRAFDVEPHAVCPGETVVVTWNVAGAAKLRTERGPNDWDEGEVPSVGSRKIVPTGTTMLKLTALDANPAQSGREGNKDITVLPSGRKQTSATCDAAGHCRGKITLSAPGGKLQVRRLSSPHSRQSGVLTPARICVSHAGLEPAVCIPPDQSADVSVVADGEWTFEADIPGATAPAPPPDLMVDMQLGCP
jgi:hypothetical protein